MLQCIELKLDKQNFAVVGADPRIVNYVAERFGREGYIFRIK